MYIKTEVNADNCTDILWGRAGDFLEKCNEDEREKVMDYCAEMFEGSDIPTDEILNDFICDSIEDIAHDALGYESEEHFDFVKDNGEPEVVYEKDGEYYTEDDLEERWTEVESACENAMIDAPYYDFRDYLHNEFEEIETPC